MSFVVEIRPGEGGDDAVAFARELGSGRSGTPSQRSCRRGRSSAGRKGRPAHNRAQADGFCQRLRGSRWCPSNPKSSGHDTRRHTSTATLAVLEVISAPVITLRDEDLIIETYRGSGPGGQHRNKTATGVRLRHRPSALVVSAEDSRSQWQNLQAAKAKLAAALEAEARSNAMTETAERRSAQIASAERPAKSFTWRETGANAGVTCHTTGRRWRLEDFRRGKVVLSSREK